MAAMMKPIQEPKNYLGDNVYVSIEDGMVVLFTPKIDRSGMTEDHYILMDAVVLDNFLSWLGKIRNQILECPV